MDDRNSQDTPQAQILKAEASPKASIFHKLRRRRDERAVESPTRQVFKKKSSEIPASSTPVGLAVDKDKRGSEGVGNVDWQHQAKLVITCTDEEVTVTSAITDTAHSPAIPSRKQFPYPESSAVFAIDVSGSTSFHSILDKEKAVVHELGGRLSAPSALSARIVPWSSSVGDAIPIEQAETLRSGGGTQPQHLTSMINSSTLLKACSLWFLLTDGNISPQSVQSFADGVAKTGLHGKACVILLFGIRSLSSPIACNISVGQAVFALSPDCAFLYYDVMTDDIYILQCKGCFRTLLPDKNQDIILDAGTDWRDLPRTTYERLADIEIPEPQTLDSNTVLLRNGRRVNVEELYHNRLGTADSSDIIDDDDNLKSILMNAQSQGRTREMRAWVKRQKAAQQLPERFDRPDLDGVAGKLVETLVIGMQSQTMTSEEQKLLKRKLREAHAVNWASFMASYDSLKGLATQRSAVLEDAMSRIDLNEQCPGSPCMLSPVSPRPRSREFRAQPPPPPIPRHSELRYEYGGQPPNAPGPLKATGRGTNVLDAPPPEPPRFSHLRQNTGPKFDEGPYMPSPFPSNPEMSKLLYLKGYTAESPWSSTAAHRGPCGLCEDATKPLGILLKAKPADCETDGDFPAPHSRQFIIYPLTMGGFPETDIISSFLCCETCAYFINRLGFSPCDEKITGVIPLVSNLTDGNRRLKLREITSSFEDRFDPSIVDQVFLSTLYEKIDDLSKCQIPDSAALTRALRWEANNFSSTISLDEHLSMRMDVSRENSNKARLSSILSSHLKSCASADRPLASALGPLMPLSLLEYPVAGFVTLMRGALDEGIVYFDDSDVRKAVCQRFFFYLAEQHADLREEIGNDAAKQELARVLSGEQGHLEPTQFIAEVEALGDSYLFEHDAIESFRHLEPWFAEIECACGPAIRLFLQLMHDLPWVDGPAGEMLMLVSSFVQNFDLLLRPWLLDERACKQLLSNYVAK